MHTHGNTGIIHIESPDVRNYTLGEFFVIWDKKFSNTQIFNNQVGEDNGKNSTLSLYINGQKVSDRVNYRDIPIKAHEIAIIYGKKSPDPNHQVINFKKRYSTSLYSTPLFFYQCYYKLVPNSLPPRPTGHSACVSCCEGRKKFSLCIFKKLARSSLVSSCI
jgi:hypothetical protein